MTIMRKLVALVAVLALSAANASAANYTSTVSGALSATATGTQVWGLTGGKAECIGLSATANVVAGVQTSQEATVHYSGCQAFFSNVHISPATFDYTANGTVHLTNTITITVTNVFGECTVTITPQAMSGVTYSNTGTGGINLTRHITGIIFHEAGGYPCGSGTFNNGTFTGDSHVFVSGGSLSFDP